MVTEILNGEDKQHYCGLGYLFIIWWIWPTGSCKGHKCNFGNFWTIFINFFYTI